MNKKQICFTRGVPPVESFTPDQLVECTKSVMAKYYKSIMQYGPSYGFTPLRELIAQQDQVNVNRVILGQGSLQLQDIIAHVMTNPGELVYAENPSYDRALTVFRRAGCHITGFPLEEDGVNVDEVEKGLINGNRPVLFYLIPDFQNPSGTVLSFEKRKKIAKLAQEYKFWIIEDSPYRSLRYRGQDIPSIFDLAPDRVFKMSSFSKLICPGLRVGYVVTPVTLTEQVARWAEDTYINGSYLNQAIVYDFQQRGWLDNHIQFLKELYRPRLDVMQKSLVQNFKSMATWHKTEGGFFIGVSLNKNIKTDNLLSSASAANLQLTDGQNFFSNGSGSHFIRLPFCSLTPEDIEAGITRLAEVVSQY